MKKRIHTFALSCTLFLFAFMIVIDYFPELLSIQIKTVLLLLIGFAVLTIITDTKNKTPYSHKTTIISGTALMTFIIVLTLLGGQSQSGIGIDNPIIWLLYVASIVPVLFKRKNKVS